MKGTTIGKGASLLEPTGQSLNGLVLVTRQGSAKTEYLWSACSNLIDKKYWR
jgi:hypothetical protein